MTTPAQTVRTEARERPIAFKPDLVRAILAGTKTQTRRVVNPQPVVGDGGCWYPEPPRKLSHRALHYANEAHLRKGLAIDFCPYGAPGDRLWVRETWQTGKSCEGLSPKAIAQKAADAGYRQPWAPVRFAADGREENGDLVRDFDGWGRHRPSIHMPRWVSRIDLEVTEVRVQRLQEISEEDAAAEGVEISGELPVGIEPYRDAFSVLWDSINADRGYGWESNCWVWAISFRVITGDAPKEARRG